MRYRLAFLFASFRYLRTVIRHRWALLLAAQKLGVPFSRVLHHDNSKFSWIEWRAYVRRFEMGIKDPEEWARAWRHHWTHNDHHIEYWQERALVFSWTGTHKFRGDWRRAEKWKELLPTGVFVPDDAVEEMVADWMAASYAYNGSWPKAGQWEWGKNNLVGELRKLEHRHQPEISTRWFAIHLLRKFDMITPEQVQEAIQWD